MLGTAVLASRMLKTTYRPEQPKSAESPLPPGWTEHTAPSGHSYYYHAETKQSTYTRPVVTVEEPLQIDYNATQPDDVVRASMQALDEFHRRNDSQRLGHFTGGRSYQDRPRRRDQGDRPKSKAPIPNCAPWVLVKTKMGRRFVHNTETKQSLWKFPSDVMMAVIEMDRLEWESKRKPESQTPGKEAASTPVVSSHQQAEGHGYDSDSYEEVEVTDEEEEEDNIPSSSKRPRLSDDQASPQPGPIEFNEDDIVWQLSQMEEDYGEEFAQGEGQRELEEEEEQEEGLPITEEDSIALFRSLLDESGISPYSTFEKVMEDTGLVEDARYVALPNMASRREAFTNWSRDRIAELQSRKATEVTKKDQRVEYLKFLHQHATPKLYWPEFKRKFKREPEMKDVQFSDKEREKLYREYISKLKLSESDRKRELVSLLKSVGPRELNRQTTLDSLPEVLLKDLRFILLPEKKRDELMTAHIATLPDV